LPIGVRQPKRFAATTSRATASSTSNPDIRLAATVNEMTMKSAMSFVTSIDRMPVTTSIIAANDRAR